MREKDLFVLERRRMESLTFEQELQGATSNTFWNGAWLLEGTVNPDGATATNTRVRLALNCGLSGGVTPETAAAVGRLTGARVLVTGRVIQAG